MTLGFRIFIVNLLKDQLRSRLKIKDAVEDAVERIPDILQVIFKRARNEYRMIVLSEPWFTAIVL